MGWWPVDRRWTWPAATVSLVALVCCGAPVLAFSGEDLLNGNPWWHEKISEDAAQAAGWSREAADAVAWHADYLDSYLYNPIWWVKAGPVEPAWDRFKVALATHDEMVKLHFDDLVSNPRVRHTWLRYLSGTVAGLVWAEERNDVAGAHNIVGASLHAVQDFYSHSNWLNVPENRERTWFEVPAEERLEMELWTGSYEMPEHLGVKPHGEIALACSVLNQPIVSDMMDIACVPISPLSNTGLCHEWKRCKEGVSARPYLHIEELDWLPEGLRLPDRIPANTVYFAPPGIALDARWMSHIAVGVRGLADDMSGPELFEIAVELATRASEQWLRILEQTMEGMGPEYAEFWGRVKSSSPRGLRGAQYEQYHRFPYMFLTVGPYPPEIDTAHTVEGEAGGAAASEPRIRPLPAPLPNMPAPTLPDLEHIQYSGHVWYLRVELHTADVTDAGTNADIYLLAGGKRFLLDYMPREIPGLAYDDLQAGDRQVYHVGPFSVLPEEITLRNDAADAEDVVLGLLSDFRAAITSIIDGIGDFLLSLISGHADVVAAERQLWESAVLRDLHGVRTFAVMLDGGGEGRYRVVGQIRRTGASPAPSSPGAWIEWEVRLDTLHCLDESEWDRGSDSDEPFLMALLIPLGGELQTFSTRPYEDVDSGESRSIGHTFARVRLPRDHGMLSLALSLMESDDESSRARRELLNEFAGRADEATRRTRRGFTTALGAAVGAGWKLQDIDVFAFARGGTIQAGTVLDTSPNRWIGGDESVTFDLDIDRVRSWPIHAHDLEGPPPLLIRHTPIMVPAPIEIIR